MSCPFIPAQKGIGCPCPPVPNQDVSLPGDTALHHYRQVESTTPAIGASFPNGKVEFRLQVGNESYWRPSASFLAVKLDVQVVETDTGVADPARLPTADEAGWAMNPVGNMFDAIEILQGGTVFSQINSNLPIVDAMDFRIKKPNYIYESEKELFANTEVTVDTVTGEGNGFGPVDGQYQSEIFPYHTSPTFNYNKIEAQVSTLVWKLPILRDIGKLPPGDYTIRLTPSQDWAQRVLKLKHNVDLADISINGAQVSTGLNYTIAVAGIQFWQSLVDDPTVSFGSSYTVTVCTPTVQLQSITNSDINERFTVDGLSNTVAVGFVDDRARRDPRLDYSSLNFWGEEEKGELPIIPEQNFLERIAVETRGRSMPNPDLKVTTGGGDFRPLYMISKSSARCFDKSEHYSQFLKRGLYLLQRIPQLENSCSDQSVVRALFDGTVDTTHGQMVLFQTTCRNIRFNVGAVCCPV